MLKLPGVRLHKKKSTLFLNLPIKRTDYIPITLRNVILAQNVKAFAEKSNTGAKCNNFNTKCNNFSRRDVTIFLMHNVITQNVITSLTDNQKTQNVIQVGK